MISLLVRNISLVVWLVIKRFPWGYPLKYFKYSFVLCNYTILCPLATQDEFVFVLILWYAWPCMNSCFFVLKVAQNKDKFSGHQLAAIRFLLYHAVESSSLIEDRMVTRKWIVAKSRGWTSLLSFLSLDGSINLDNAPKQSDDEEELLLDDDFSILDCIE